MSDDNIVYTSVPPNPEIAAKVFRLFERVYGDPQNFIKRWEWELMHHPRSSEVLLHCAEMDGELVGVTVRHPVSVAYRGTLIKAYFASNSMVAPETRGKGVVQKLYHMAAECGALQLSKGTAPAMYNILKKIGYKDIFPNTFLISYLRPVRIILQKLLGNNGTMQRPFIPADSDEMQPVSSIPENIGDIAAQDGIVKDADYLRWRYLEIPIRKYQIFVRSESGKPVSLLVLRSVGTFVYLVDLIWDRGCQDEPAVALAFAKKAAQRMGAYRMVVWTTSTDVRRILNRMNFIDKGESPRCSFFIKDHTTIEWQNINLVHGDGDIDYL